VRAISIPGGETTLPPRIPDEQRAAILADIKAGELSRNDIARKHKRAEGTITNIARDAGLTDAFDRTETENATRARTADLAARRTQLASDLLDDTERLRKRSWSKYVHVANGSEGLETITLDLPPLSEVRNAYTSVGICVDKHLALVKANTGTGDAEARSMLGALAAGLGAAYEQLTTEGD
jgi:hypothetical protein